jgi:hypothetical protein
MFRRIVERRHELLLEALGIDVVGIESGLVVGGLLAIAAARSQRERRGGREQDVDTQGKLQTIVRGMNNRRGDYIPGLREAGGALQNEVRAAERLQPVEADHEVRDAVAVGVAHHVGIAADLLVAKLSGDIVECVGADEGEGFVGGCAVAGIGVDEREIDMVAVSRVAGAEAQPARRLLARPITISLALA